MSAPLRTSAMIASFADPGQRTTGAPFGHALVAAAVGRPSVILCDTKVGRGVPLLEEREKAHCMRLEDHEWQICREQLSAGYEGKSER